MKKRPDDNRAEGGTAPPEFFSARCQGVAAVTNLFIKFSLRVSLRLDGSAPPTHPFGDFFFFSCLYCRLPPAEQWNFTCANAKARAGRCLSPPVRPPLRPVAGRQRQPGLPCWPNRTENSTSTQKHDDKVTLQRLFFSQHTISTLIPLLHIKEEFSSKCIAASTVVLNLV